VGGLDEGGRWGDDIRLDRSNVDMEDRIGHRGMGLYRTQYSTV
jgi:hypothetical protein